VVRKIHLPNTKPLAEAVGLTTREAYRLLGSIGPNAIVDVAQHPLWRAFEKPWAPVPWMLEAAIAIQLGLGDYTEAAVATVLLLANAALGFFRNPGRWRRWMPSSRAWPCQYPPGETGLLVPVDGSSAYALNSQDSRPAARVRASVRRVPTTCGSTQICDGLDILCGSNAAASPAACISCRHRRVT
jgi:hypothetical protein